MKTSVVCGWVVALVSGAAMGQLTNPRTFEQDELLNFQGSFDGTINSVTPSGTGVLLNATSNDAGSFSRFVTQLNLGGADLSAFDGISLRFTNVGGTMTSAQMFVQTGPSFFFQQDFDVQIPAGQTVTGEFVFAGLLDINQVQTFGIQFFGPGGTGPTGQQIRLEPTGDVGPVRCSPADFAAPLGALDIFDIFGFFGTFGAGCPTTLVPLTQADFLSFGSSFAGSVLTNVPDGNGSVLTAQMVNEGGFSRFATEVNLPSVDWSSFSEVAIDVELQAGTIFNLKMFVVTDPTPADPNNNDGVFFEGPLVNLALGSAERAFVPLGALPNPDQVVRVGFQFFGPGGLAEQVQVRLSPSVVTDCGDADLGAPFGTLNIFDIFAFFNIFGQGC